jgi:hypothetical protein
VVLSGSDEGTEDGSCALPLFLCVHMLRLEVTIFPMERAIPNESDPDLHSSAVRNGQAPARAQEVCQACPSACGDASLGPPSLHDYL